MRGVEQGATEVPSAAAEGPAGGADHERRGEGGGRRRGQALRAHHGDVLGAAVAREERRYEHLYEMSYVNKTKALDAQTGFLRVRALVMFES